MREEELLDALDKIGRIVELAKSIDACGDADVAIAVIGLHRAAAEVTGWLAMHEVDDCTRGAKARGNRKSRRCEPVVKRMCKVVEVEA